MSTATQVPPSIIVHRAPHAPPQTLAGFPESLDDFAHTTLCVVVSAREHWCEDCVSDVRELGEHGRRSDALVQISRGTREEVHERVAKRTKRAVCGCPVRRRKMLPALNVWHRPRKAANRELHAPSGNASCLWQPLSRGTSACGDGE